MSSCMLKAFDQLSGFSHFSNEACCGQMSKTGDQTTQNTALIYDFVEGQLLTAESP